jgi:hypothetical protein
MARRLTLLRRLVALEAAAVPLVAARTRPPLPAPVLAYCAAAGIPVPNGDVTRFFPAGLSGRTYDVYACAHDWLVRRQSPPLVEVQREVLVQGVNCVASRRTEEARDRRVAAGDANQSVHDRDWPAAVGEVFHGEGAGRLIDDLWNDAGAWVAAWRTVGTADPALLALLGFGPAELALLRADELPTGAAP